MTEQRKRTGGLQVIEWPAKGSGWWLVEYNPGPGGGYTPIAQALNKAEADRFLRVYPFYEKGEYSFSPPPVPHERWDTAAWLRYVTFPAEKKEKR